MEIQSSPVPTSTTTPALEVEKQKKKSLKIGFKPIQKKLHEINASSSSTEIHCSECNMSFSSTKALCGHLRIHRKSTDFSRTASLLTCRNDMLSEDFMAASILMRMRNSKLETDINDAKRSKLSWVCENIKRQRKNMREVVSNQSLQYYQRKPYQNLAPSQLTLTGQSVEQHNGSNSNQEKNVGAAGSVVVETHQCDKCNKVFNSGQALGGHKRAHYTKAPICRLGSKGRSLATVGNVAVAEPVVRDFDLNEPVNEVFL